MIIHLIMLYFFKTNRGVFVSDEEELQGIIANAGAAERREAAWRANCCRRIQGRSIIVYSRIFLGAVWLQCFVVSCIKCDGFMIFRIYFIKKKI